jgi:hypothetical protein
MGGAAVYRYEAVEALEKANLLGRAELAGIGVHEDHIFGFCLSPLALRSVSSETGLTTCRWELSGKGLPADPNELLALGKSIIHSTKGFRGHRRERDPSRVSTGAATEVVRNRRDYWLWRLDTTSLNFLNHSDDVAQERRLSFGEGMKVGTRQHIW